MFKKTAYNFILFLISIIFILSTGQCYFFKSEKSSKEIPSVQMPVTSMQSFGTSLEGIGSLSFTETNGNKELKLTGSQVRILTLSQSMMKKYYHVNSVFSDDYNKDGKKDILILGTASDEESDKTFSASLYLQKQDGSFENSSAYDERMNQELVKIPYGTEQDTFLKAIVTIEKSARKIFQ